MPVGPKGRIAKYIMDGRQVWDEYDEAGNLVATGGKPRPSFDREAGVDIATPEQKDRFMRSIPEPRPRNVDGDFNATIRRYDELLDQYAEPDQVFRPRDLPDPVQSRRNAILAGSAAGGLGTVGAVSTLYEPTSSGQSANRRRAQRARDARMGEGRRLHESLEDQFRYESGIYGPQNPTAAAMAETLRGVPGGDFIPGVNQLEKYAWGDRFGREDVADVALTATDFLPFTGPPGAMAGILTPMKSAMLEKAAKKSLGDVGDSDVAEKLYDAIDHEVGLGVLAHMNEDELGDFVDAFVKGDKLKAKSMAEDAMTGKPIYAPGELEELPIEELEEEIQNLSNQFKMGLISKTEFENQAGPVDAAYESLLNVNKPTTKSPIASSSAIKSIDDLQETTDPEQILEYLRLPLYHNQSIPLKRRFMDTAFPDADADKIIDTFGPGVYGLDINDLEELRDQYVDLKKRGIEPSIQNIDEFKTLNNKLSQGFKALWNANMTTADPSPRAAQIQELLYEDMKKGFDPAYGYKLNEVNRGIPAINRFSSPHVRKIEDEMDLNEVGEPIADDYQSRMARAQSMGFRDVGVHTTDSKIDFSEFEDLRGRGAVMYTNPDPDLARQSAQHFAGSSGERQMPIMFRGKIWGRDRPPEWLMPERMSQEEFSARMEGQFKDLPMGVSSQKDKEILGRIFNREISPRYYIDAETGDWVLNPELHKSGMQGESHVHPSSWGLLEEPLYETLDPVSDEIVARRPIIEAYEKMGYPGWLVQDEGGFSFATNSPERIRSRFARFNPRLINSRNIMSGLGLTAIPGAATLGVLADMDEEEVLADQ